MNTQSQLNNFYQGIQELGLLKSSSNDMHKTSSASSSGHVWSVQEPEKSIESARQVLHQFQSDPNDQNQHAVVQLLDQSKAHPLDSELEPNLEAARNQLSEKVFSCFNRCSQAKCNDWESLYNHFEENFSLIKGEDELVQALNLLSSLETLNPEVKLPNYKGISYFAVRYFTKFENLIVNPSDRLLEAMRPWSHVKTFIPLVGLQFASDELRNDPKVADNCIAVFGLSQLYHAGEAVAIKAVSQSIDSLNYMSEAARSNPKVLLAAIKRDPSAMKHAAPPLKRDKQFLLDSVAIDCRVVDYAGEAMRKHKPSMLAFAKVNGQVLRYVSDELKRDRDVVLAAVTQDGNALEYASEELKNDPEIVLAAARQNGHALMYADKTLRKREDILLVAVATYPQLLDRAPNLSDELLKKIIEVNPRAFNHLSDEIQERIFPIAERTPLQGSLLDQLKAGDMSRQVAFRLMPISMSIEEAAGFSPGDYPSNALSSFRDDIQAYEDFMGSQIGESEAAQLEEMKYALSEATEYSTNIEAAGRLVEGKHSQLARMLAGMDLRDEQVELAFEKIDNTVQLIKNRISRLKEGESIIIPGGSRGHVVAYKLTLTAPDRYNFELFDSQSFEKYYESVDGVRRLAQNISTAVVEQHGLEVPILKKGQTVSLKWEDCRVSWLLNSDFLKEILVSQVTRSPNELLVYLLKNSMNGKESFSTRYPIQIGSSCTYSSILACAKGSLPSPIYDSLHLFLMRRAATKVNDLFDSKYLLMVAESSLKNEERQVQNKLNKWTERNDPRATQLNHLFQQAMTVSVPPILAV